MVTTVIVPRGSTRKACWDTYSAISINKQDCEACARSHTLTHTLAWALVGLLAQRVVLYACEFGYTAIDGGYGLLVAEV